MEQNVEEAILQPQVGKSGDILLKFERKNGGERGIRTPGGFHLFGFQDRRLKPLDHLSAKNIDKKTCAMITQVEYPNGAREKTRTSTPCRTSTSS